jgi:hypothetical protein
MSHPKATKTSIVRPLLWTGAFATSSAFCIVGINDGTSPYLGAYWLLVGLNVGLIACEWNGWLQLRSAEQWEALAWQTLGLIEEIRTTVETPSHGREGTE